MWMFRGVPRRVSLGYSVHHGCVFACIGGRVDIVVNNAGKSESGGGYCSVKVEPRVDASPVCWIWNRDCP